MINEYNPSGKDIRFIDSHYKDLFRIPDGSCIQIHYPDETVVKPCKFIDEYHTQIGNNVFHICQFAEIMERNGASYMAEPEIMGNEAAWRVGEDRILAIQANDEGYDYSLLNENFVDIDGGQVNNLGMTMIEVRQDILESFGLAHRGLRAMVYQDVIEQVFETGRQAEAAGIEALLESKVDSYAILQLKDIDETMDEHFLSFSRLQRRGKTPNIDHYDLVYMGHLPSYTDQSVMLEGLYTKFNIDHPKGFRGHSMSVSDIVALKTAGEVSFHYVDSFGFKELQDFLKLGNRLKTSGIEIGKECVMSDDTLNGNKAPGRERPSVLGQMKDLSGSEITRKPFRSHSERGIE